MLQAQQFHNLDPEFEGIRYLLGFGEPLLFRPQEFWHVTGF
jgi:hypothetical protein